MDKITVVVPCWNEDEAIPIYYEEMNRVIKAMEQETEKEELEFELIFVDDGSTDGTLRIMKEINRKDDRCRYL